MQTEIPDSLAQMQWIAEWVGDHMVVQPFGEQGHDVVSEQCPCKPIVEVVEGTAVIMLTHNAFDGRE